MLKSHKLEVVGQIAVLQSFRISKQVLIGKYIMRPMDHTARTWIRPMHFQVRSISLRLITLSKILGWVTKNPHHISGRIVSFRNYSTQFNVLLHVKMTIIKTISRQSLGRICQRMHLFSLDTIIICPWRDQRLIIRTLILGPIMMRIIR